MSKATKVTNSIRALRFAKSEMTQADLARRALRQLRTSAQPFMPLAVASTAMAPKVALEHSQALREVALQRIVCEAGQGRAQPQRQAVRPATGWSRR